MGMVSKAIPISLSQNRTKQMTLIDRFGAPLGNVLSLVRDDHPVMVSSIYRSYKSFLHPIDEREINLRFALDDRVRRILTATEPMVRTFRLVKSKLVELSADEAGK